jgi:hypothetical protein
VNGFHGVELPFCGDLAAILHTNPGEAVMTQRWSPEDDDDEPRGYDNGGWLQPASTAAFSAAGAPEVVWTAEESARLAEHLKAADGRPEFEG